MKRTGESMTEWRERIHGKLVAPAFQRADDFPAAEASSRLGVPLPEAFTEFFRSYVGPFGSKSSGFELLDICEGHPTIVSSTIECRGRFGWPERLVVLTDLLGNSVLVLDGATGAVYNVDFEGGERLIVEGRLPPSWNSFEAFLEDFFR
ncbi:MAG TPA: SMI1/KNR4 family protein [Thermoanaerobaculia bacterium]|nr:SMI1/KNR4 family protein [Thermoanaerobaculia bacterium]